MLVRKECGPRRSPPIEAPLESGGQDSNLRPLGPEPARGEFFPVAPDTTESYPADLSVVPLVPGSHTNSPTVYGSTQYGAPVARPARVSEAWLTPSEVASRLKLSRATIYALIKRGALPHRRVGLSIRIASSDFEQFLASD